MMGPDWKSWRDRRIDWQFWIVVILLGLFAAAILISVFSGCAPGRRPAPTQPGIPAARAIVRVVSADVLLIGRSWTAADFTLRRDRGTALMAAAGVQLQLADPRAIDHPAAWENADTAEVNEMSRAYLNKPTILLVDTVRWNGVSHSALGIPNWPAIVGRNSCENVFAHECAHCLGLDHAAVPACDVMNADSCLGTCWSDQQVAILTGAVKSPYAMARISGVPFMCGVGK